MSEVSKTPMIYSAINNVMAEIGAVGKNQKNQQQGFMYRGIDAVMNAINPALVKNGVFIVPEVVDETREERQTAKGGTLFYTRLTVVHHFYASDGSYISTRVIGEAMDSADKASNKAMSIAYKYACFQVFCIPTEEMLDPDAESPEVTGQKKKPSAIKKETVSKDKLLGEAEADSIKKELERTGLTEEKICSAFGLKQISEMTMTQYTACMNKFKVTPDKKGE